MASSGTSLTVSGSNNDTKIIVDSTTSNINADDSTPHTHTAPTAAETRNLLWTGDLAHSPAAYMTADLQRLMAPLLSGDLSNSNLAGYDPTLTDPSNVDKSETIFIICLNV